MTGPFLGSIDLRLPEQLLRARPVGPFPSATGALKFLLAVGLGTVVAATLGTLVWLPFIGGGFLIAVWRPDGRSLDERCWGYLRWRFRREPTPPVPDPRAGAPPRVSRVDGVWVPGVIASGTPITFLPVDELRRRFDAYRALLDGLDAPMRVRVEGEPVRSTAVVPSPGGRGGVRELAARAGYRELLSLLLRRRRIRRVRLDFREPIPGAAGARRLAARIHAVTDSLEGLEVPWERIGRPALREFATSHPGTSA